MAEALDVSDRTIRRWVAQNETPALSLPMVSRARIEALQQLGFKQWPDVAEQACPECVGLSLGHDREGSRRA